MRRRSIFPIGIPGSWAKVDRAPPYGKHGRGAAFLVVQSEFPDVVASRAPSSDGSSPVVLFVYVVDVDSSVERAVAEGAKILMPAQDQFWGDRTARILDPAGHVWTVASRIEQTTEDQRAKRWSAIRDEDQ